MKREEFNNLKIGDICVVKRGHDRGKKVIVRYIEDEQIVIKDLDNKPLRNVNGYTVLRLTGWRELDIINETEES